MFKSTLTEVKEAFKKGHNINEPNGSYRTPLLFAIKNGKIDIIKFLIENGADVNCVNLSGRTYSPLVQSIKPAWRLGYDLCYEMLKMLLEHGANPNQAETKNGYTPLTRAIHYHYKRKNKNILIEYGADVNLKDYRGRLPLALAIEHQDLELIKFLLDEGAEFSIQKVFLKAIETENLKIVQMLIERGAKVNHKAISGKTPLTYAVETSNHEVVKLLIDAGAEVNLPDANGDALLTRAIKLNHIEMVKLLYQNGVRLGRNFQAKTALDAKNFVILKYLIEMGADFNVVGSNGRTPLTLAVEEQQFDLVKSLLDRGADVNQVDGAEESPFSVAVAKKNLRFAKYLQERGAAVECVAEIKEIADEDDDWKIHFENLL